MSCEVRSVPEMHFSSQHVRNLRLFCKVAQSAKPRKISVIRNLAQCALQFADARWPQCGNALRWAHSFKWLPFVHQHSHHLRTEICSLKLSRHLCMALSIGQASPNKYCSSQVESQRACRVDAKLQLAFSNFPCDDISVPRAVDYDDLLVVSAQQIAYNIVGGHHQSEHRQRTLRVLHKRLE